MVNVHYDATATGGGGVSSTAPAPKFSTARFLFVPDNETPRGNLPMAVPRDFPDALPLIIMQDQVVFPLALVPISIRSESEFRLINDVHNGDRLVAIAAAKDGEELKQSMADVYDVGCIARIVQVQHGHNGHVDVMLQTLKRCRITGFIRREPYPVARILPMEDIIKDQQKLDALAATIKTQMGQLIALSPNIPDGVKIIIESVENPSYLADMVAGNLSISKEEKQRILALMEPQERITRLMYVLQRELEIMELSSKLHENVKSAFDKGQREFFLRQQLRAIQEELGEGEAQKSEAENYRKRVEALDAGEDVRKELLREVDRLARLHESSGDYHVILTYLDTVLELPWNKSTRDRLDIKRAEAILDEDHFGLERVKKRILEYLAVRKLKPDAQGPILCFIGPPGVGKTSLGKSIAKALGREFGRIALGGLRDEAEIRGHRRTYVGAMPGRIIQLARKVQSRNPVVILDELDKIGNDFRGDPSSALLEVLDPAQNNTFTDNYLNLPFDLSKFMFIATANVGDTIPWALRDRMEIIDIAGYTQEEKFEIAKRYLVPRQLEAHGISADQLKFSPAALRTIISNYTREAGVRNLEREIGHICRGSARKFASRRKKPITINIAELREHLGPEKVRYDMAERTRQPGVVIGLAWTAVGGDILFIEATRMSGKGTLILTGQLGDVMKESARTALSYLRANAAQFGIADDAFADHDVHIHVPAGATPKDGPSAGVAMLTAMTSLMTGKRVKSGLAMTGEITLRGMVLPVGGIKEKVLAASRAKVKEVILPEGCRAMWEEDVPENIKEKLTVHFVSQMHEVLGIALGV
ncbi:MAG: endopeptidase La [Candidatus Hydrogenedentes bacterium]|nr:endopeptidase La [Candidatus Hydrogenedentota bacterium]